MTEKEAYIAFNLTERVGSVAVSELVEKFGTLVSAWESFPNKTGRLPGYVNPEAELEKADRMGVQIITPADPEYPRILKDTRGHPLALYVKGSLEALSVSMVSIVGTRNPSQYGVDQAEKFAFGLAKNGWGVLSGLALGIDAAAHRGALDAGGTTVGVIGSGLDKFFPKENIDLAREIVASGGAVVSEFPFGRSPDQKTFPQRNRIVAALAHGVIAIEAPVKSGTLITTGFAADIGRHVMALPGRVDCPQASGCLNLIRDGARLVRSVRDVEEELGGLFGRPLKERSLEASPREARSVAQAPFSVEESLLMRHVTSEGISLDDLVLKSGLSAAKVNSLAMSLRVKGRLRFFPGNRVALPREN